MSAGYLRRSMPSCPIIDIVSGMRARDRGGGTRQAARSSMMHLALDYIDASDTWLAGTTTAVTLTGDWTRYSVGQASAPTGTDHVDFSLYVGGVDDGDTIDVCADGALLEKSASLGSYVDGESDSASWDAEENASTSTLALGWRVDYLYDEAGMPYGGLYRENGAGPLAFLMIISDRGDVLELLDADGNPFVAYRYDVWGKPLGAGNHAAGVWTQQTTDAQSNVVIGADLANQIADRQVLRYAGYAYDAESGLYYCSARYYDPLTCQFLTRDPAKADGEESAYQYCGGDPVGQSDSSGKYTLPNVTQVNQYKSLWCWAASSICAVNSLWPSRANHYWAGSKQATYENMQRAMVKQVYGDHGDHDLSTLSAYLKWTLVMQRCWRISIDSDLWDYKFSPKPCPWDRLVDRIRNKKPVMMNIRWLDNNATHALIVYRARTVGRHRRVGIMDPGGRDLRDVSYSWACSHGDTRKADAWVWEGSAAFSRWNGRP